MLPFALAPGQKELQNFAKSGVGEDYDALPRGKRAQSSGLSSFASVLQKLSTNITQLLVIIMVTGLAFRIFAYETSSTAVTAPATVVAPATAVTPPAPSAHSIVTVPQVVPIPAIVPAAIAAAAAAAPREITNVQTSRFNHNYFCTVKRTRWLITGLSKADQVVDHRPHQVVTTVKRLAIDFLLVGDRSLGDLQEPMASTLKWEGGSAKPTSHTYEVDDLKNEFVEGTLVYEGVPQDKTLDFEFGSSGYSWVKLSPPPILPSLALAQVPAGPQPAAFNAVQRVEVEKRLAGRTPDISLDMGRRAIEITSRYSFQDGKQLSDPNHPATQIFNEVALAMHTLNQVVTESGELPLHLLVTCKPGGYEVAVRDCILREMKRLNPSDIALDGSVNAKALPDPSWTSDKMKMIDIRIVKPGEDMSGGSY